MPANRISKNVENRIGNREPDIAVQPTAAPPGFVSVPAMFNAANDPRQASWAQSLYRAAYDQARIAIAARNRIRNFTFIWN